MKSSLRLLSQQEADGLDARAQEWREALGIPDPEPSVAPADEPHLMVVSDGLRDDGTGEAFFDDAMEARHTDRCGHDGMGGYNCLLWALESQDGLPFRHVDDPDADLYPTTLLRPGTYWVKAWASRDYWGEWDAGIDLMYPEEEQNPQVRTY